MKASARTKAEFWVGYWFATKHIKHWIEIWRTRANRERIENRMMQVNEWGEVRVDAFAKTNFGLNAKTQLIDKIDLGKRELGKLEEILGLSISFKFTF